jgi:hypothetical protein
MDIFFENWAEIILALLAFVDIVVSLTPTDKDDRALGYIRIIVEALAGKRKKRKE